ncbi:MAG: glycogen/starch synthase, ADP-glucose type [Betaproteobacteria bacterium]|nr:glycogen/starch synthase, ADP-glucose type [Betaproteobacteria bacterium]
MRILFAASEMAPWVKTGGLGDVAAALPIALTRLGNEVKVLLPAYPGLLKDFSDAPVVAELAGLGGTLPDALLREARTPEGVGLLLIDSPALYTRGGNPYLGPDGRDWPDNVSRFGLLSRAAALLASESSPLSWKPEVLHCHDWQSALAPAYLHYLHTQPAGVLLTVHNLAFQGKFARDTLEGLGLPARAWSMDGVEFYNELSFLKAGVQFADWVSTVSPTYAREIQTDAEGMGMAGLLRGRSATLSGILNGIDETVWNPALDPLLPAPYSQAKPEGKAANKRALQKKLGLEVRDDVMLFGVVSRLTYQKGLDLLAQTEAEAALIALPAQLAVLGSGEAALEEKFSALAKRHPGQVAVTLGFDEGLAHLIEAGADCFVMPSRFEPCGLNQMYSLAYGTPPIVRATGGLADTVIDLPAGARSAGTANGFVLGPAVPPALIEAMRRAHAAWRSPALWRQLQANGMGSRFDWRAPAGQYAALYRRIRRPAA